MCKKTVLDLKLNDEIYIVHNNKIIIEKVTNISLSSISTFNYSSYADFKSLEFTDRDKTRGMCKDRLDLYLVKAIFYLNIEDAKEKLRDIHKAHIESIKDNIKAEQSKIKELEKLIKEII